MIYLASPYTHQNNIIRQDRYISALHAVGKLTSQGKVVYSPVVHFHNVAALSGLPTDFYFWREINYHMIDLCDELMVLQLAGWETSFGVAQEIQYSIMNNKPVIYMEEPASWHE